ncbi:50S ribosomal protein L29 [Candidatus Berkelbacteria bacterium CG08_land_8_20_14_0_20_39_8]|uniref:Large ribosomal subunit protein uL29 n=1 Tax=Candidatus Berkelbacteria bacterium CG08_land_8_20_14_0_20_39_8 TaxID=1974511 RepID=A0A2M6YCG3_9BACT|nr:MAG: 50S ribosomal protein L29 [Candidatus Berkelbacteria bacterium CG08_land_8_20_14_0_20_39_8]
MKRKERVNKIKSMKKADLQKERVTLIEQIFSLRVDIANHKTKGIHKIKQYKHDIARINTQLTIHEENNV